MFKTTKWKFKILFDIIISNYRTWKNYFLFPCFDISLFRTESIVICFEAIPLKSFLVCCYIFCFCIEYLQNNPKSYPNEFWRRHCFPENIVANIHHYLEGFLSYSYMTMEWTIHDSFFTCNSANRLKCNSALYVQKKEKMKNSLTNNSKWFYFNGWISY